MSIVEEIKGFESSIENLSDIELKERVDALFKFNKEGVLKDEKVREDIIKYSQVLCNQFHQAMIPYMMLIYHEAALRWLNTLK